MPERVGSNKKTDSAHYEHSSLREKIIEHVFVADLLRTLWRRGVFDVEILRSEFDAHGYDLVIANDMNVRHIQLKAGVRDKPLRVSIPIALSKKPSGCVIWIQIDNDLNMKRFWWFGGKPGHALPPLGDRYAKRIGRKADGIRPTRIGHKTINGSAFRLVETLEELLETLFGPLRSGTRPVIADRFDSDEERSDAPAKRKVI